MLSTKQLIPIIRRPLENLNFVSIPFRFIYFTGFFFFVVVVLFFSSKSIALTLGTPYQFCYVSTTKEV